MVSCEKKDIDNIDVPIADKINAFIWKGMNTYYLWKKEVPNLADNRFRNFDELFSLRVSFLSHFKKFKKIIRARGDNFEDGEPCTLKTRVKSAA